MSTTRNVIIYIRKIRKYHSILFAKKTIKGYVILCMFKLLSISIHQKLLLKANHKSTCKLELDCQS